MDNPALRDIYSYGTLGMFPQLLKMPDGTVKSLVEGKSYAKIKKYLPDADFFMVEVEKILEYYEPNTKTEALIKSISFFF